jgi:general stress protein 26
MSNSELETYLKKLEEFDAAMLVTRRGPELRARPMAIARRSDSGRLAFLTSVESGKLEEISDDPSVNLALQNASQFMSISGTITVTRDRDRVDELWTAKYEPWFPEGKDDSTITVLDFVPTYAEYWDNSGVQGVKALYELGRAAMSGEVPSFDGEIHDKIDFPRKEHKKS